MTMTMFVCVSVCKFALFKLQIVSFILVGTPFQRIIMNEEFVKELQKLAKDVVEIKKIQGDIGTTKDTAMNSDETLFAKLI